MQPLLERTGALTPIPTGVLAVSDETHDTFTVELEPPVPHFAFLPGQFTMMYVFGVGEVPISISGNPADTSRIVQTIRGVGAVTRALRGLQPGDHIGLRGPFGNSWPVTAAQGKDVVFIAGGVGLAPLRSAIYHCLNNRADYGRIVVLYGTRTPNDILFVDELRQWGGRFDMDVLVTVDNAGREWTGSVGVVTKLIPRSPFDPGAAMVFVCGPEIMMRFTGQELLRRGVPGDRIFVTMERNMKCGVGFCGHCQFGPSFVCREGPIFGLADVERLLWIPEV